MTGAGLVIGVGARRGVTAPAVRALLDRVAAQHRLDLGGAVVATVDSKLGERGLCDAFAGTVPVGVPAAVLAGVAVPHPSGRVARELGTPSVAEAAALHTARERAGPRGSVRLVVAKTSGDGVTVAVARYQPS